MSDGDSQVKASVLCNHTAPVTGASPTELCYSPDLLVSIRQHQVIPDCDGKAKKKNHFAHLQDNKNILL